MRRIASLGLALDGAPDAAAAGAAVVDHVAGEGRLLPSVYLARGGRLRCAALRGYWQARDGMPPSAGVIGRTYRTAIETVVENVADSDDYLEAHPGVVAEACLPVVAGTRTVGVLNVESHEPLRDGDLEALRECAALLGRRIDALGGLPTESTTQRLVGHMADMAALEDAGAIVEALLRAARGPRPAGLGAARASPPSRAASPRRARPGRCTAVLRAARHEPLVDWVRDGTSCFSRGLSRTHRRRPTSPTCARPGSTRWWASGCSPRASCSACSCSPRASRRPWTPTTSKLLEQLATHAAACLRTVELLGSLRERAASDPLTGLGHHATFHDALASCRPRARRGRSRGAPSPVSGSDAARSRSEPSSSTVRGHAAACVASCSRGSTSSVSTVAGSPEAGASTPREAAWANSPTPAIASTPASRRSARLAAGGVPAEPAGQHEVRPDPVDPRRGAQHAARGPARPPRRGGP